MRLSPLAHALALALALGVTIGGCYDPSPPEGAPCTEDRNCPSEQRCYTGACLRQPRGDASPPDVVIGDDATVPLCTPGPVGAFSSPVVIPALSDPTTVDGTPSLTGDRLEVYLKSSRSGGAGASDIWRSIRATTASAWSIPVVVTELNSAAEDASPEVTADGLTIWFSSQRSGGPGGRDIWVATRPDRASAWSAPTPVVELNTPMFDDGLSVLPSLLVAYLHSTRGGTSAFYRTSRPTTASAWSAPILVAGQDLASSAENAWVSPDECEIYFASNRVGGGTNYDLYVATRSAPTDPIGAAVELTELSSASWDDDIWLSSDRRYIMFNSNRVGGPGQFDLYEATR